MCSITRASKSNNGRIAPKLIYTCQTRNTKMLTKMLFPLNKITTMDVDHRLNIICLMKKKIYIRQRQNFLTNFVLPPIKNVHSLKCGIHKATLFSYRRSLFLNFEHL